MTAPDPFEGADRLVGAYGLGGLQPTHLLRTDISWRGAVVYLKMVVSDDMTPLQFQKQLQLQEARRLMLNDELDASTAGYRVGYNDASHFNREYKRLFGRPPVRDVERLRQLAAERAA